MTKQEYLNQHGISETTASEFGLEQVGNKLAFPVKDSEGYVMFNKYRHLDFVKGGSVPKFSYDKGSSVTLYNSSVLLHTDYVFLCEGEPDCIKLTQEGFPAVSSTSGAGVFKEEWIPLFSGKKVYLVYDTDSAGKSGAEKLQTLIPGSVILSLPPEVKDVCEYFQSHTKEEFISLMDATGDQSFTYKDLCDVFDKWLLLPDKNVIRILLATLVAHFFETDPLWMFFVAPPSGSKTEIISTISTLPFSYLLSDLTPNTLASGMPGKGDNDPSLLTKLHDNVLIMKDFTTVLSMRQEDKLMILAQLREIYDGKYTKAFGTGKKVEWEGRLSLIAGVTSIIDTQSSIFHVMGERFIMYRVPQARDVDVAIKALDSYGREKEMRKELREAMTRYFNSLQIPRASDIKLPREILVALATLTSFIVKARTALVRDNFKRELDYIPQSEAPARLAKQLGTLIKALAVLEGRNTVNWSDFYMTLRVAFDIVPANRMAHLIALCGEDIKVTTNEVIKKTNYSRSGAEIILEDLTAVEIVEMDHIGQGVANEWGVSHKSHEYFKHILPFDSEELKVVFPENDKYAPLIKEMLIGTAAKNKERDDIDRELGI